MKKNVFPNTQNGVVGVCGLSFLHVHPGHPPEPPAPPPFLGSPQKGTRSGSGAQAWHLATRGDYRRAGVTPAVSQGQSVMTDAPATTTTCVQIIDTYFGPNRSKTPALCFAADFRVARGREALTPNSDILYRYFVATPSPESGLGREACSVLGQFGHHFSKLTKNGACLPAKANVRHALRRSKSVVIG
eukprot:gene20867-biopygen2614